METGPTPEVVPYDIGALLVSAFLAAKRSGKSDWRRMKIAVLKNRMLQLSKGKFKESFHGVHSFRQVLEKLHEKVTIEGDVAVLTEPAGGTPVDHPVEAPTETGIGNPPDLGSAKVRIRPDLWQAVIDYSSGAIFAWDTEGQRARRSQKGDTHILPTVKREEFGAWRLEFAKEQGEEANLSRWMNGRGSMAELPFRLRGPWSGFLRLRVEQRLKDWFTTNELVSPSITEVMPANPNLVPSRDEDLREMVLACVKAMTPEELERLFLPAAAMLRARQRGQ